MIQHYPVAVWSDADETAWTAVFLDSPDLCVFAPTRQEAVENLREYVVALSRQEHYLDPPEFEEPQQVRFKVGLRPEYKMDKKTFPLDVVLDFTFPCVTGKHPSGLQRCVIPSLGLQFYYEESGNLKELVTHYVQGHLAGRTPAELLRVRPPAQLELTSFAVKSKAPSTQRTAAADEQAVASVAEPLARVNLRCYGREGLARELEARLRQKASVLLIGPPGVGKTSLAALAAKSLEKTSKIWLTSSSRLIAGMRYLGEWEERCQMVIAELAGSGGILACESLLELVRQGGANPSASLAGFFLPYLQQGELQMVAEATPSEFVACQQLLPGIADVFQILNVPPFAKDAAVEVMEQLLHSHEQRTKQKLPAGSAADLVRLLARFAPYSAFPGNAAKFLRVLEKTDAPLIEAFSQHTGVPERFLRDDVVLEPEDVLAQLQARVIGQDEAVGAACRVITTFKAGLQDPERPLAVMLLCGPTGVGKTELAKTLAEFLFGNETHLIRLDMSEYGGWDAAERLQNGPLVRELRLQPLSVVLFDEVEKAHPEVFDVLLRAFDEGLWTDPYGRETSFRSSVIVMTSNLGAELVRDVGLTRHPAPSFLSAAQKFFRPEFLNRVDQVLSFRPLQREHVASIAAKEVAALARRPGLRRRRLQVEATPALLEELVRRGYDERLGARPLQRQVERIVVRGLAGYLAERPDLAGGRLLADWDGQALRLTEAKTNR